MTTTVTVPAFSVDGVDYADARACLVERLEATVKVDIPSVDVFYTSPIDLDTATSPHVHAAVKWDHSKSTGVGVGANQRLYGSLVLSVAWKEGGGSASANNLITYLNSAFRNKNLGKAVTSNPFPGPGPTRYGWETQQLVVPFWYDSVG